jgi:type II secretory pathway predicted ATPase ExeA
MICALSGRETEARRLLSDLKHANIPRYAVAPGCAAVHAELGETDEALNLLEECYQERTALVFLAGHPSYEALFGDPRFVDLLRRVGIREISSRTRI